MNKSKSTSEIFGIAGALSLAIAFSLSTSTVEAIPYASLIRVNEPNQVQGLVDVEISYTLNESVDSLTLELVNTATNAVIRTFAFAAPDPKTMRGRHTVNWDGETQNGTQVVGSNAQIAPRITVQKVDGSTTWTKLSSNSPLTSPKNTEKKSLFADWRPNDVIVPQDPTVDSFGYMITPHAYLSSPEVGLAFLQSDLEPFADDGGGMNLRLRNSIEPGSINLAWWKGDMDPIDPNLIWVSGQASGHVVGVGRVNGGTITDVTANAGLSLANPFLRSIAIREFDGDRLAYVMNGNFISRYQLDASFPYVFQVATRVDVTGSAAVRYTQDIEFDRDGNLYFLSRSATPGLSELWRWSAADVAAATSNSLNEANAQWRIRLPGTDHNSVIVDRSVGYPHSGNVYTQNNTNTPRGVWLTGNVSDTSRVSGNQPLILPEEALVISGTDLGFFDPSYGPSQLSGGLETDWLGNLYMVSGGPSTDLTRNEIHSFSPPAKALSEDPDIVHTITTTAPPSGRFVVEPSEFVVTLETAFAFHESYAACFREITDTPRWGWTVGPLSESTMTYHLPLYAEAAKCEPTKGEMVGMVTLNYSGGTVDVQYAVFPGNTVMETHLYVGEHPLPMDRRGQFTVAPGLYPFRAEDSPIMGVTGEIYVVAHAVVEVRKPVEPPLDEP